MTLGYRVVTLVRRRRKARSPRTPFAEGWLRGARRPGAGPWTSVRPDGSLLVSDDQAGAIYRITYVVK